MECTSPECVGAKADVQALRAKIVALCSQLKILASLATFFQGGASSNTLVAVGILLAVSAAAMALGVPLVAIVAGIMAALVFVVWFVSFVMTLYTTLAILGVHQELQKQMPLLLQALAKVPASCPPECLGDMSVPTCQ